MMDSFEYWPDDYFDDDEDDGEIVRPPDVTATYTLPDGTVGQMTFNPFDALLDLSDEQRKNMLSDTLVRLFAATKMECDGTADNSGE